MEILLIRHGDRHRTSPDEQASLSDAGRKQATELATSLKKLEFNCNVFLTSKYVHAAETASILAAANPVARIHEMSALTPHSTKETLDDITSEAKEKGLVLPELGSVVVTGHEPRLGQLFTRLTSTRTRPLENCEAICVSGTWKELFRGRGTVVFRTPVDSHDSESLAEKIHRKMEVSVFLAALTIPALIEIIKGETSTMLLSRGISAFFLTLSLSLYVAAVYIYDELSMPEGFWLASRSRRAPLPRRGRFATNYLRFGPMYQKAAQELIERQVRTHRFSRVLFVKLGGSSVAAKCSHLQPMV